MDSQFKQAASLAIREEGGREGGSGRSASFGESREQVCVSQ